MHQLLQYKKFKDAAAHIFGMARPAERPDGAPGGPPGRRTHLDRPLQGVSRIDLWNTFNLVLRRLAEKLVVGEIHDETVTVTEQMEWLMGRMRAREELCLLQAVSKGECR